MLKYGIHLGLLQISCNIFRRWEVVAQCFCWIVLFRAVDYWDPSPITDIGRLRVPALRHVTHVMGLHTFRTDHRLLSLIKPHPMSWQSKHGTGCIHIIKQGCTRRLDLGISLLKVSPHLKQLQRHIDNIWHRSPLIVKRLVITYVKPITPCHVCLLYMSL